MEATPAATSSTGTDISLLEPPITLTKVHENLAVDSTRLLGPDEAALYVCLRIDAALRALSETLRGDPALVFPNTEIGFISVDARASRRRPCPPQR
tara:strand:- start:999 stop:1286 length:288 start_codon:yes stop_codon:yes gene_type:complete